MIVWFSLNIKLKEISEYLYGTDIVFIYLNISTKSHANYQCYHEKSMAIYNLEGFTYHGLQYLEQGITGSARERVLTWKQQTQSSQFKSNIMGQTWILKI